MTSVKECNICGRTYEPYNMSPDQTKHNSLMFVNAAAPGLLYTGNGLIECCPNCMNSIKKHIDILAEKGGDL